MFPAEAPFHYLPLAKELHRRMESSRASIFEDKLDLKTVLQNVVFLDVTHAVDQETLTNLSDFLWDDIQAMRGIADETAFLQKFQHLPSFQEEERVMVGITVIYLMVFMHHVLNVGKAYAFWQTTVQETHEFVRRLHDTKRHPNIGSMTDTLVLPYLNMLSAAMNYTNLNEEPAILVQAMNFVFRNNWEVIYPDRMAGVVKDFQDNFVIGRMFSFLRFAASFLA